MRLPALEARSRLILYTFERAGVVSLADIPLQGNHTGSSNHAE